MNPIKLLLIVSFLALFVWGFRNRGRVGLRAGTRVFGVVLTAAAVLSILMPDVLQWLADRVGVTRGTDLLLYVLVVVFVSTTVGAYFRFRELERRLAEIVRADAIRDATVTHGMPGHNRAPQPAPDGRTQQRASERVGRAEPTLPSGHAASRHVGPAEASQ